MKTFNVTVRFPGQKYEVNYTISALDSADLAVKVANMGGWIVRSEIA